MLPLALHGRRTGKNSPTFRARNHETEWFVVRAPSWQDFFNGKIREAGAQGNPTSPLFTVFFL